MAETNVGEIGPSDVNTGEMESMQISLYLPFRDIAQVREFRLLKVHTGYDHQLSCELLPFRIHHSPSFRALSYTWKGAFDYDNSETETSPTEDILVEGQVMTVGKNLANALRAIRDWHDGSDEFVWADAICIDQSNFRERAYQVSIMGEIYCNADSVFIWLGDEAQDSDRAMDFMKVLARCRRDIDSGRKRTIAMAQDPKYLSQWKALEAMMNRRWWSRVWVLQETVLARRADFCCGRAVVRDEDIFDGARALRDVWDQLWNILDQQYGIRLRVATYHAMDGMNRLRAARLGGKLFPMLTCHHRTMSPRAADARDYVFGKMGMASDGYIVRPTYLDPVHDVYANFVAEYIQETKSLEIIHFDARPRETPNLPSWVPDWAAGFGAPPLQPDPNANPENTFRYYSASKNEPARVTVGTSGDPSQKTLVCKGYVVDIVDGVAFTEEASWAGRQAARPMSQSRIAKLIYGSDSETFEALWQSLTASQDHHGNALGPESGAILATSFCEALERLKKEIDTSRSRFDHAVSCMRDFIIGGQTVAELMVQAAKRMPSSPTAPVFGSVRAEVEGSMAHALGFRRLLTTENGYLGTGPIDTETSDVVAILFGSSVPVILRPAGDGLYAVVGAGNIHGIMYGEAMNAMQSQAKAPETIRLV